MIKSVVVKKLTPANGGDARWVDDEGNIYYLCINCNDMFPKEWLDTIEGPAVLFREKYSFCSEECFKEFANTT